MFSYLSPEQRVRKDDHPLRAVRAMTDEILERMSPLFDVMYASGGRPSIPPEKLLRAQLLQMLYSVRSERLLMEEIDYSILYRWFVGLNLDETVWDATTFTKNRDRLLEAAVAKEFLAQVVEQARVAGLISDEHFTVDGTLLEAWASLKSFQPKDKQDGPPPDDQGNPTVDFHGQKRSNETHESKTDPDALLARKGKGKEAKLSYNGDLLIENRNGLIVNAELPEMLKNRAYTRVPDPFGNTRGTVQNDNQKACQKPQHINPRQIRRQSLRRGRECRGLKASSFSIDCKKKTLEQSDCSVIANGIRA